MTILLFILAGIGAHFLITKPLCRACDAIKRREYEKRRESILSREDVAWRRKVQRLTKEDQELSARIEQQERDAQPKTHEDFVQLLNNEAQVQEIHRKEGLGVPNSSFGVHPGIPPELVAKMERQQEESFRKAWAKPKQPGIPALGGGYYKLPSLRRWLRSLVD
jgi:hypothetical protein